MLFVMHWLEHWDASLTSWHNETLPLFAYTSAGDLFPSTFLGTRLIASWIWKRFRDTVEALLLPHLEVNLVVHFSMLPFTFALWLGVICSASDYCYSPPLKKSVHLSFELSALVTLNNVWHSMLCKNPFQTLGNIGARFSCERSQQKKAWESVNNRQNISLQLSFIKHFITMHVN